MKTGDSPEAENILDILRASSVAQDILLVQNKMPEEEPVPMDSGTHKLDEYLKEDSVPTPPKQKVELPPEPESNFTQKTQKTQETDKPEEEKPVAGPLDPVPDLPPGETVLESGHSEQIGGENSLLHERNALVAQTMSDLNDPVSSSNVNEDLPPTENIMAIVKASAPSQDILMAQHKTPEDRQETE